MSYYFLTNAQTYPNDIKKVGVEGDSVLLKLKLCDLTVTAPSFVSKFPVLFHFRRVDMLKSMKKNIRLCM